MTRFGSRSAQSFKPPAPSAAPSTQRPVLPAPALDIAPDDNQPPASATDDNELAPFPLLLSPDMETPSSSTTTPSPLLGYLRPDAGPSSSKLSHRHIDMVEAQERQQAVQKFLAGAEMSKVCASPCSTDWWIRRRVCSLQMSQTDASASACMRVYSRIPFQSALLPLLNAIINASSFSSCSLLAPCARVWDTLHTRLLMTFREVTYAISKPKPPHNLSRTHALTYSSLGHLALSAGRDPWVLLRP